MSQVSLEVNLFRFLDKVEIESSSSSQSGTIRHPESRFSCKKETVTVVRALDLTRRNCFTQIVRHKCSHSVTLKQLLSLSLSLSLSLKQALSFS